MKLDQAQILELLQGTTTTQAKVNVKQFGPLHFHDDAARCVSKKCGCQTNLTVNGLRYCTVHALHKLNRLLITDMQLDDCTCKSGYYSSQTKHSSDCAIYPLEGEL